MYPTAPQRHPASNGPPPPPHQSQMKFTIADSLERIKEEFNFLQGQYHSLKLECEKLSNEKTEMQRHYVMYYEMSYGLNVEMQKQTEVAKRLNSLILQLLPFLAVEHQQQVAQAVERAKQVTMPELNAIIGQQIHAQQIPGAPIQPMAGLAPMRGFPGPAMVMPNGSQVLLKSQQDLKPPGPSSSDERMRNSISPGSSYRTRSPAGSGLDMDVKRPKQEIKVHDSDGEKSESELIVDMGSTPPRANGDHLDSQNGDSNGLNGDKDDGSKGGDRPPSQSAHNTSRSTPNLQMKGSEKPGTPGSSSSTPKAVAPPLPAGYPPSPYQLPPNAYPRPPQDPYARMQQLGYEQHALARANGMPLPANGGKP